ncbi:MAG TPA: HNH endonuclease [Azospirillum sp.]
MYATTRQLLVTTMGTYCSYCEVPLGVSMPVEHKMPKTYFEGYANKFSNLTLSCTMCNTAKGARPTLKLVNAFYNENKAILGKYIDQDDPNAAYWCGLLAMVWPDTTGGKGKDIPDPPKRILDLFGLPDRIMNLFLYVREKQTAADLAKKGVLRLHADQKVTDAWARDVQDCVWVYPNETYIADKFKGTYALQKRRVLRSITTMNLNYRNPRSLEASDRRVDSRTATWDVATDALALLAGAVASVTIGPADRGKAPPPPLHAAMKAIRQMALATGHWSVWMTVFSSILTSTAAPWAALDLAWRKDLIQYLFVCYGRHDDAKPALPGQPNPPTIFLGTDPRRASIGSRWT